MTRSFPWFYRRPRQHVGRWAREVVDTIPLADLPREALCFADSALRSRDPARRAMHVAKLTAALERLEEELRDEQHPG